MKITYTKRYSRLAMVLLAGLAFFCLAQSSSAGPITGGPGNPPFAKLSVYQGVISIVPGTTGDVMEIGNVGRDIASTGSLVLRPNGNVYISSGSLCFGGMSSADCKSSWSGLGGTTPNLDSVLGTTPNAGVGIGKSILLTSQSNNAQSFGATSDATLTQGSGNYAFMAPNLTVNGAYNNLSMVNDSGLFYNNSSGFVLGPWASNSEGLRITPTGNVGIGYNQPVGKFVVNNGTTGTGSSGDAIDAFANSANSAIYAQQSGSGYAGYITSSSPNPALYVESTQNLNPSLLTGEDIALRIQGNAVIRGYGWGGIYPPATRDAYVISMIESGVSQSCDMACRDAGLACVAAIRGMPVSSSMAGCPASSDATHAVMCLCYPWQMPLPPS